MKDSSKVVKDTKIESYNQKELLEKIRKIVNINLNEAKSRGFSPDIQDELGRLIILISDLLDILDKPDRILKKDKLNLVDHCAEMIEWGIDDLLSDSPDVELVSIIRRKIELEILKKKIEKDQISRLALNLPSLVIFLGLVTAGIIFVVVPPIISILIRSLAEVIYLPNLETAIEGIISEMMSGIQLPILLWAGLFGILGSVVSVLTRIQQIVNTQEIINIESKTVRWAPLFFTGLFKPFIGLAFAIFICSTALSGLIPLEIQQEQKTYFFISLAFIAGFSERLGQDITEGIVEKITSPSGQTKQLKSTASSVGIGDIKKLADKGDIDKLKEEMTEIRKAGSGSKQLDE